MRKWTFPIVVLMVTLLVVSSSAISPAAATAVWKDINPTAYLNPPETPDLGAVVMFPGSPQEGWAVGTAQPPTNATTSLPGIFHYDGEFWDLVSAPRFPDFPSTQCPYNLRGLSFGPPNNPINKNDGWAVGQAVRFPSIGGLPQSANQNCINNATAIHWDGVSWKVQMSGLAGPDAGALNSTFMVSSTDVWAVGQDQSGSVGTIWHWTGVPGLGGGWNLVTTVPDPLNSVFMVSSTEGWAVGRNPSNGGRGIYHYFAGGWTAVPSPFPPCPLNQICELASVFMISPTEGWAVGTNGVILHYSQGVWSGPVSPGTTTQELLSVFMVSSGEGWAVGGGSTTQTVATILHYTGGIWSALPVNMIPISPTVDFDFASAFFTTATDGWAVGRAGVIVHFDGSNWGSVTSPSINNFTSVSFGPPLTGPVNPNDGWAVGNVSSDGEPTIFHWNGFVWTKGTAIGTMNDLNSVFMLSTGDAWAVGGGPQPTASCASSYAFPGLCPVILHFTGGAWNTVTPPPGSYRLKSVFMVSPTEGWAVGEQADSTSSGILLHYTVTGGVGTWGIFPGPPSIGGLDSVFMLGPYEGWAVGDNSTILHYTVTGGVGTWNIVPVSGSPTLSSDANLTSVFMLSPTSGWIVGGIQAQGSFSAGPVILYWDGLKWSQVATPSIPGGTSPIGHTSATLKSVFCSGPNDCWAAGFPGILFATLFHWDGVAWTHVVTAPALIGEIPPILTSIYLTSADAGWIVGSDPEFPSPLTQSFAFPGTMVEALSTILWASPTVVSTTSTSTVVSTLTTQTTFLTAVTSSPMTTASSTSTTIAPPSGPSGFLVPVILAVVVALVVGLVAILLLQGRRKPPRRTPAVLYPIPRRP